MLASTELEATELAPFLGDTRARVDRSVAGLLGVPAEVASHWESLEPPAEVGQIGVVQVGLRTPEGRELKVLLRDDQGTARWVVEGIAVSVRPPGGGGPPKDPDLRAVLAVLVQRFGGAPPTDAAEHAIELRLALGLHHEFPNQDDVMFRRVERTHSGHVGMLRMGFRCNQDCYFCPQSRSWQDPPEDLVAEWLEQFGAAGLKVLTITGGEPTTYRTFPELVHRAVHHWGMVVLVQTNAIQFAKDGYVHKMREAGLQGVFVSFHSHREEVSDRQTRSPRTWKRTVKGVENALAAGFGVALNCCVEANNYRDLPAHAQFIVDRFVTPFPDNPIMSVDYSQPGAYWHAELMEGSVVPYDEVEPYLAPALRILRDAGVGVNATSTCGFVPCMFRSDPELIPWRPRERYDLRDLENRSFLAPCEGCAARSHCVGVRGDVVERFGDRGLVPYATLPMEDDAGEFDFDIHRIGLEVARRRAELKQS